MSKLPQIKPIKVMKILKKEGFSSRKGKGSHIVLNHTDGRRTVVPIRNKPLSKGTLNAILRQTNIPLDVFLKLLRRGNKNEKTHSY